MVDLLAEHRPNHSDVIDDAAKVGEPIGNRSAGLPITGEDSVTGNDWPLHRRLIVCAQHG